MSKYYSVKVGSDEVIGETNKDGVFGIHVDGWHIEVSDNGTKIAPDNESVSALPEIEVSEFTGEVKKVESDSSEKREVLGVLRACCRIGNRYWCITGGCANTPCGWICG